ncbi:MAG: hypothetical protein ACLFTQ_00630 [Candidatus Aenigmatarchaeota archaeon]
MDEEKISTGVHAMIGAATGYISNFTGSPLYAVAVAIIVLLVAGNAARQLVEGEGVKWWIGNSVAPFLLFWAIFSVFFYNL